MKNKDLRVLPAPRRLPAQAGPARFLRVWWFFGGSPPPPRLGLPAVVNVPNRIGNKASSIPEMCAGMACFQGSQLARGFPSMEV